MKKHLPTQHGFTLIEMIIAISIIGVIGVLTTEMFSRIILLSKKTATESEIKRNSETVLAQIERIVRNAERIELVGIKDSYASSNITWIGTAPLSNWDCATTTIPSPSECGIIVKNSEGADYLYTKLVLSTQAINIVQSTDDESCGSNIYSTETVSSGGQTSCNGSVRVQSSDNILALRGEGGVNPRIGEVALTNIDTDTGVNISSVNIQVEFQPDKPTFAKFDIAYRQPIKVIFRDSADIQRDFTAIISLRNY